AGGARPWSPASRPSRLTATAEAGSAARRAPLLEPMRRRWPLLLAGQQRLRLSVELFRQVVEGRIVPRVEVRVEAADGQQLVVGALLDDASALQHDDLIGITDRGQAMGDDQARTALEQYLEGLLDLLLGEAVDARRRLVEHQDLGIGDQRPREAEQLA